jgi:hypothetical protein
VACWEVGAGGMSVPRWLAAQVGPTGLVLATDIDTSWLAGTGAGVVEQLRVLRHDVGLDDPPAADLDLVHARLVLTHVPRRDAALASMIAALRPATGCWSRGRSRPATAPLPRRPRPGPTHLANRLRHGFRALMAGRAADLAYGRTLPWLLRDHGLAEVRADAYFPITAPACTTLERATVEQVRDRLISNGIATAAEIDQHLDNIATGRVPDLATSPMVSAWGRKP